MRKIVALLLLFAAHPAFAAWALVGSGSTVNGSVPVTLSYPSGSSTDIIICTTGYDSNGASLSIGGFTTVITSNTDASVGIFWKIAGSTSSGSVSATGAAYGVCSRWSGGPSTLTGNVSNSVNNFNTGVAAPAWPNMTIADANTLVIVVDCAYFGSNVSSGLDQPSPWGGTIGTAFTSFDLFGAEYVIQTTATNITTGSWSPTLGGSPSGNYETVVAALKPGSAGSSCSHTFWSSTGTFATPNGSSGSYWSSSGNGSFATPNCSSGNYWRSDRSFASN